MILEPRAPGRAFRGRVWNQILDHVQAIPGEPFKPAAAVLAKSAGLLQCSEDSFGIDV